MTIRPLGRPPGVGAEQLRALVKPLGLKPLDIAELTRSAISRHRDPNVGGHQCSQVNDWLNGRRDMPQRVFELLEAKVWLIENDYTTLEQAKRKSLVQLLKGDANGFHQHAIEALMREVEQLKTALKRYGEQVSGVP